MTKLLQGKSLYIAKHMHGQLLHADVDDHADPQPVTRLAPCISIATRGNQPLKANWLDLTERTGAKRTWNGEKIGVSDFLFNDIPEHLSDAKFYTRDYAALRQDEAHLSSFLAAAKLHWHHVLWHFFVITGYQYGGYPILTDQLAEGEEYSSIDDDYYSYNRTRELGTFSINIYHTPGAGGSSQDWYHLLAYSIPKGCWLAFGQTALWPYELVILCDLSGEYSILWNSAWPFY